VKVNCLLALKEFRVVPVDEGMKELAKSIESM